MRKNKEPRGFWCWSMKSYRIFSGPKSKTGEICITAQPQPSKARKEQAPRAQEDAATQQIARFHPLIHRASDGTHVI